MQRQLLDAGCQQQQALFVDVDIAAEGEGHGRPEHLQKQQQ
jgi:hypothetical protein